MRARFVSFLILSVCLVVSVSAQSFGKMWKEVKAMEQLDRPQSALKLSQAIFEKAKRERNVPEMLKAYVSGMEFREKITPDSLSRDINGLEQWLSETREPIDAAVLHSVLAEMYADYFTTRRLPSYRSEETSEISADMNEWSGSLFVRKIFDHIRASLKSQELLVNTNVDAFRPVIDKGETSVYFHHDMFHFLGQRGIMILSPLTWRANDFYPQTHLERDRAFLPTSDFLNMQVPLASEYDCLGEMLRIDQSMLRYYSSKANWAASVLVDLGRLNLAFENIGRNELDGMTNFDDLKKTPYYNALTNLTILYARTDVCAEVYKKMADFTLGYGYPLQSMEIAGEAMQKYPSYERKNMFRQLEADILEPRLHGASVQTAYPGEKLDITVSYRNLPGFALKLYSVNLPATSPLLDSPEEKSFRGKHAKFEKEIYISLIPTPDFRMKDTVLRVDAPYEGIWMLEAVPDAKVQRNDPWLVYVSRLKVISRILPGNVSEFVVVDAETGYPVDKADVILYRRDEEELKIVKRLVTNAEGIASVGSDTNYDAYRAQKGNDQAMPYIMNRRSRYDIPDGSGKFTDIHLFTDKGIYRPGQTVYVAGIAYTTVGGDSARVLPRSRYKLALYDANRKMLAEKELITNDFGSFSGEFQLPLQCLPGSFSIRSAGANAWFRVEEYKRPTFSVAFETVKQTYHTGDSLRLTGVARTYSGVPVQNAEVSYTFKISYPYWLRKGSDVNIATGTARTNDKGIFNIQVYLQPQSDNFSNVGLAYNYVLSADVTDGAGETQNGSALIPSGNNPLIVSCDMPQDLLKEGHDSLTVKVLNLNGEPQPVGGTLEVFQLDPTMSKLLPVIGKQVLRESFVPNKAFRPESILRLPSGMYRLVLCIKDSEGKDIKDESDFALYSLHDRKPPYQTDCWFKVVKKEFTPDSPATLLFGSSLKDAYVLYDLFSGDKRLESKRILLTDSVMKIVYPYKTEYGEGLFVQFAFVKDGKLYQESTDIIKALPDKKLKMKWESFRDKLKPGQQEEWKLQILSPDGKAAEAELLATLYDASLDRLAENDWSFDLPFFRRIPRSEWKTAYPQIGYFDLFFPVKQWKYKGLTYDRFVFGSVSKMMTDLAAPSYTNSVLTAFDGAYRPGTMPVMRSAASKISDVGNTALSEAMPENQKEKLQPAENIQIRDNFAETAFFYPQLRTDKQGTVSFSFILPQSLTQWKFKGFSHTRTMDWGITEALATASKEFMIAPNLPRFVRMGDRVSIAANVVNLTGKEVTGIAVMELFNPENENVFVSQEQNFSIKAGETGVVSFSFTVGENYPELLACRMTAKGDSFSDGEQRYLPVLSNKQLITESVPMLVEGNLTREFSLASLFNKNSRSATERRLTVEFTGNPAWYAVQALPYLSNPTNENAISWASAYYANSVASYIANSNPRIKAVFDTWKQQGGTKETLLSNLEKNQELKNILLNETPWAVEATNEAGQKQRIATLFDLNTIQYNNSLVIDKLKTLQQNGAWSWFKGMEANRYVTLFVAEALGRVPVLTGTPLPSDAGQLLSDTWKYLHKQAQDIYRSMLEAEKSGNENITVPDFILRYLYLGAITSEDIQQVDKKAYDYFIDRVGRTLTAQNLYQKALSAVVLQKAGRTAEAANFIRSLKEYAVQSPDMGIYYDSPSAPYSGESYRIPVQVAVLEAMQKVAKDTEMVEQMKIWLLRQKQAQSWDSPVATVNAVYALLEKGSDLLANNGNVKIYLGKQLIESQSAKSPVAGLDYVKKTFEGSRITSAMTTATVVKQGAGIAWGAVYAQYLENISQVSVQGGPLSVSKKLYVERTVDNRSLLIPLNEAGNLSVGDKLIVRLMVKTDRDMDFIQLKDSRAACLEPVSSLSGYRVINNTGCYVAVKDASTEFFFDGLRKGTYLVEYAYFVTRTGDYLSGLAVLQSAYAPEFTAHSASEQVKVIK